MRKNNKKGFTIVELVIVIAVIAILAAVLIPTFAGATKKATESKALQEAKNSYSEDLALLDGQASNYMKEKYVKADGFVAAGAYDAKAIYYSKAADATTYTFKGTLTQEEYTAAGTLYTATSITKGEFDGAKYTYETAKYTCTYENGTWDIVEK